MKGTANIDAWNSLPMAEKAAMIKVAVGNGITNLQDIRDKYNEFAWGGPSEAAKKRIERWEGKAMTGAKDPLSGKYARNSSFEDEARRFYSVLPKNIREQVLSNPELADNLYSYSYNVGAGNFKKRVVPALQRYYAGKGSVEDIQRSMWASGDTKLRGLQRRRTVERAGVGRALLGGDTPIPTFYTETATTGNESFIPFKPMIPEVFGAEQPIEAPVTIEDIPPTMQKPEEPVYSPEEIERQERVESLANLSRIFSLMNGTSENSGMLGALNLLTGNYANGGKIHIKPSHKGRFTRLKERTGHSASWFKAHGTPAQKKMATFELNARKWKHGLGGNLFEIGGPKDTKYDKPQTFAGRVAQVAGASPKTVREADVISSVAQMTPYGYTTAALDLGRDINRTYHGEEGALIDTGLDLLGMIPGVSKLGLKKIKPKAVIDKVKQGYDEFLQPVRQGVNSAINAFKALDFIDDTLGADKTSDTKQRKSKHGLGGNLYPDGGYVREVNGHPIAFDYEGNLIDQVTGEKGYMPLPEVSVTANPDDVARGRAQRWYKDFGIESNDATSVASGRRQNSHLDERDIEGAAKAAAWAKAHPVLNTIGLGLSALPLAVAATPAVAVEGELAATALANPYVDAALTSMGGAHAAQSLANGEANWMTALELAPLGRLARPLYEGVVQPGMRLFNSPLTGNWTKIGNREYRLSPNSLGANGSPLESRDIAPQITTENAASITPEQWTAAQDAAIARGDMAETQRLRDLHFKVKTSGDTLDELGNPLHVYHGSTEKNITEFYKPSDLRYKRPEGRATAEEGIYTSPSEGYASIYAIDLNKGFDSSGRVYDLYSNTKQMPVDSNTSINYASLSTKDANLIRAKGYNGITDNGEHVVLEPNQLKLADAVTYDVNGIKIPLGLRDNFKINDIRYGLLPFLGLGTAATLYGRSNE